ncbi:beta-galactosidase GalA [Sphingomonas sp.]|uniref:beta-galactosidase GalA n=1 Tax=Sphingomonas sp. TaxID=28214 RepID=UPI003B3AE2C6
MMRMRMALAASAAAVVFVTATRTAAAPIAAVSSISTAPRERIRIDDDWRFALGDAHDPIRDFGYGTAPFFFAKAGYGDGPASPKFDDRAWRRIDVPHDWGVEVPFDPKAETNHGSRAIGPGFPHHNIGWYRKTIDIPEQDRGRRIAVEFDGVFRDAVVWFNGHYIGEDHSGYSGVRYDLTDYVNYSGPNVLVVRADTSTFEGWFYEGAGIYRHVWLTKTAPLHVGHWGTFVTSEIDGADAKVTARATIVNDDGQPHDVVIDQEILSPDGKRLALVATDSRTIAARGATDVSATIDLKNVALWSLEQPRLHQLVTTVREGGQIRDRYVTAFGVRSIRWDADTGFWLNGRNIKLKGTNNHQDHAGIGVALPDEMQVYRLERLKAMGSNAYRASHNPPTPEMLDAADRLGMLVIDEHRMMGTTPEIRDQLDRMILRDRNHPSVILWSVGNEEWGIEGREIGARLTKLMQERVHDLDDSRPATAATAGNDGKGISTTTQVAGFNYRSQHDVDAYHRDYPRTPIAMTEEGSTFATRGIYFDDRGNVHLAAYDKPQRPTGSSSIEQGWRAVVERPWMAGMFVWTGFDYRGETTPFDWPAISSQFGMLDTTGLFKDSAWYLKSQWTDAPMTHIVGHWNWAGREGQPIPIWVYANADAAELTLNGHSLGRRAIPANGHAEWQVPYAPGKLIAISYRAGKRVSADEVVTTGAARALSLSVDRPDTPAGKGNIAVVDVTARDATGRIVPIAADDVHFSTNDAEILGVGNGDPGSHEADRFIDAYAIQSFDNWQIADLPAGATTMPDAATLSWRDPFRWYAPGTGPATPQAFALRGRLAQPGEGGPGRRTLFLPHLVDGQRLIVNGVDLTASARRDGTGWAVPLDGQAGGTIDLVIVIPGRVEAALSALENVGIGGKNVAYLQTVTPAGGWHRKLFSGHAQIIVKLDKAHPLATLTASAPGLRPATVSLRYNSGGDVAAR